MSDDKTGLTYADAGVDIDAGNALIDRIKPAAKRTNRSGVMAGLGGFGGLFDLKDAGFSDPVLVAATDGVGTKLRIAIDTGHVDTIGVDLVAMCVNDLICQGAEPLFFLDYFATGKLELDQATAIINGIAAGCEASGCALIGGETAEMPGMYSKGDFDLAGFAVGAMERGTALGQALLAPTRLYVKQALAAIRAGGVHGLAHITGGGLTENLPRVMPEGLGADINLDAWDLPPVFGWLAQTASISEAEMLKTFNSGIGMVLVVQADRAEALTSVLRDAGETVVTLGHVTQGEGVRYTGSLL